MSEFLGKTEIRKEDLPKWLTSKEFAFMSSIAKWFLEENNMHIHIVLSPELREKFEAKVIEKFGKISASNIRKAALQAIKEWSEK